MSSDLLLRYGRLSEAWWYVIGFKAGTPPLDPPSAHKERAAEADTKHQKALQDLLHMVAFLRDEVKRLENWCISSANP